MSRAHFRSPRSATESLPGAPALAESGAWELADAILFSILSSLVLWIIILTSVYHALT